MNDSTDNRKGVAEAIERLRDKVLPRVGFDFGIDADFGNIIKKLENTESSEIYKLASDSANASEADAILKLSVWCSIHQHEMVLNEGPNFVKGWYLCVSGQAGTKSYEEHSVVISVIDSFAKKEQAQK